MWSMPPPVRDALKLYLEQQPRRSLRQLAEECAQRGIKASVPTLKRWSARFGWQRLVAEHDGAALEESMTRSADYRAQILKDRLKQIDVAKQRYDWLIDPDNPNVTPAQRKRATDVTLSDFLRILKMETDTVKLLRQLEASRQRDPARSKSQYADEEMHSAVEALIRQRHGLPSLRVDRRPLIDDTGSPQAASEG
jgi:hypothetical protein